MDIFYYYPLNKIDNNNTSMHSLKPEQVNDLEILRQSNNSMER